MPVTLRAIGILSLVGFIGLFVCACSIMDKKQCSVANWRDLGVIDGRQGFTMERFSNRSQACAEHGIGANREQYIVGYRQGIAQYCTDALGYRAGYYGHGYRGVCQDSPGQQAFMHAYRQGRRVYLQRQKLEQIDEELSSLERKIESKESKKSKLEAAILSAGTEQKRFLHMQELRIVTADIIEARSTKNHLQHRRKLAQEKLENMPENRY